MFEILLKAEKVFIIPLLMDMRSNWRSLPKISGNFSENSVTLKVISIFQKTPTANDVNWEDYFYEYILNKLHLPSCWFSVKGPNILHSLKITIHINLAAVIVIPVSSSSSPSSSPSSSSWSSSSSSSSWSGWFLMIFWEVGSSE